MSDQGRRRRARSSDPEQAAQELRERLRAGELDLARVRAAAIAGAPLARAAVGEELPELGDAPDTDAAAAAFASQGREVALRTGLAIARSLTEWVSLICDETEAHIELAERALVKVDARLKKRVERLQRRLLSDEDDPYADEPLVFAVRLVAASLSSLALETLDDPEVWEAGLRELAQPDIAPWEDDTLFDLWPEVLERLRVFEDPPPPEDLGPLGAWEAQRAPWVQRIGVNLELAKLDRDALRVAGQRVTRWAAELLPTAQAQLVLEALGSLDLAGRGEELVGARDALPERAALVRALEADQPGVSGLLQAHWVRCCLQSLIDVLQVEESDAAAAHGVAQLCGWAHLARPAGDPWDVIEGLRKVAPPAPDPQTAAILARAQDPEARALLERILAGEVSREQLELAVALEHPPARGAYEAGGGSPPSPASGAEELVQNLAGLWGGWRASVRRQLLGRLALGVLDVVLAGEAPDAEVEGLIQLAGEGIASDNALHVSGLLGVHRDRLQAEAPAGSPLAVAQRAVALALDGLGKSKSHASGLTRLFDVACAASERDALGLAAALRERWLLEFLA